MFQELGYTWSVVSTRPSSHRIVSSRMKFFLLSSSPVDDEATLVLEIISHMNNSVVQLSHNNCSATIVQGYLIFKFVKERFPIKNSTKYETVLRLIMNSSLQVEQEKRFQIFRTIFYNIMALDMSNAVKNLKINTGDIIVLHKPVLRFNKSLNCSTFPEPLLNKTVTVEVGLGDDQAIDVWQYCKTMTLPNSVSSYTIKSLEDLIGSTSEDPSQDIIFSYFIKPVQFWKDKGKVVKAICFFREIQPNGKAGSFFKLALHKMFAQAFHQQVEDNSTVSGDVIVFVNPEIFKNPGFNSDLILSEEPYFLEVGRKENQNIGFCNSQENIQLGIDNSPVKKPITCWAQTPVAVPQINSSPSIKTVSKRLFYSRENVQLPTDNPPVENLITCSEKAAMAVPQINSSYSPSVPPVSNKKTSKLSDETCLTPISLVKPSKDTLSFQNLSLVSGYCYQFCHKMFMHSEILWNRKNEPLCPKCFVTLEPCLCLEFDALLRFSGELVKILLVGPKAERLLQVRCKDFMHNDERRKIAVKVLESKYVYGSEYKNFNLKVSDVSCLRRMV